MSTKVCGGHGSGLARHFTARRSKNTSSDLGRTGSLSIRSKISGPVELIHTTNMHAFKAPDIHGNSASTSAKSDSDSDSTAAPTVASSNASSASSPPTSPELSDSPESKASPEPNHLSCYFTAPSEISGAPRSAIAPVIPSRAPSHTKKVPEVSRKRSINRFSNQSSHSIMSKASFTFSRSSSTSTANSHFSMTSHAHTKSPSASITSPPPLPPPKHALPRQPSRHRNEPSENPFGQELAKVAEIAEELGVDDKLQAKEVDDEKYMRRRGLNKITADDYIAEIEALLSDLLEDIRPAATPLWI